MADLLRRPRYEVLPLEGIEDDIAARLGDDVFLTVTGSPSRGLDATLELSELLARGGYTVVPHLPARQVHDQAHLDELLDRILAAGIRRLFVPAGDAGSFVEGRVPREALRPGSIVDERGRVLGRHKLAPSLSPGKTWEGFLAGTAAAIAVAFFALYEQDFLTIPESIALGAAVALAGAAGDLFESALKRDLQVKDSGQLLGGHGGMLDRIDSLLFAAVAAFYVVTALA